MSSHRYIFSSESVTEGHPDKMADQISDAILDRLLAADSSARVACETLVTTGMVVLAERLPARRPSIRPKWSARPFAGSDTQMARTDSMRIPAQ